MRPSSSSKGLTRRHFIGAAGASAAGVALMGSSGCRSESKAAPDRLNVLLVILDSVRSDFVAAYGAPRVQTPSIDALAAQGVRFTRFFPEAMPTVPARRTIMTGRRIFPFRGWKRAPDLGRGPGAAPIEDLNEVFTTRLGARGLLDGVGERQPLSRLHEVVSALSAQLRPLRGGRRPRGPSHDPVDRDRLASSSAGSRRACAMTTATSRACASTWPTPVTAGTTLSRMRPASSAWLRSCSRRPPSASPSR